MAEDRRGVERRERTKRTKRRGNSGEVRFNVSQFSLCLSHIRVERGKEEEEEQRGVEKRGGK